MGKKYNESTALDQEEIKAIELQSLKKFKEAYDISYKMCSNRENCKGCMYKTWRKGKCLGEIFYKILRELYRNSKIPENDIFDDENDAENKEE